MREIAGGGCQGPAPPTSPPTAQGNGLPGQLTLLGPNRTGCPPPLLRAAPEGSVGHAVPQRGEGAQLGPQGGLLGPWPTPDQLERPPPHVGWQWQLRGQRWKTGQPQRNQWGLEGREREAIKDRDICSFSRSKYRVD